MGYLAFSDEYTHKKKKITLWLERKIGKENTHVTTYYDFFCFKLWGKIKKKVETSGQNFYKGTKIRVVLYFPAI